MAPRTSIWDLDPHTEAKHELLRRYLDAWYAKLASGGWNRRLIFMDGFAGPGVYSKGEPGSPIIALARLVDHVGFDRWDSTEFVFFFIENDARRLASLTAQLDAFWEGRPGGKPSNVRVHAVDESFAHVADELVGNLERRGQSLAPTLAFVDPFGYSEVPLDTICRLTRFDKCEILFNFMFSWLTRATGHPDDGVRGHLDELFGTRDYEQAHGMEPAEKKEFLHRLYERQLRERGKFSYVLDFEMVDRRGKSYSLFYGTRAMKGLEEMKRAMWRVDPSGQFRFSDRHAGQTPLFGEATNIGPLRTSLVTRFKGHEVTIEELHEFVLVDTIYGPDHYRRNVLAKLENEGQLYVVASRRKRPVGYPPGTVLRFA